MNMIFTKNSEPLARGVSGTVGKVQPLVLHGGRPPHWLASQLRAAAYFRHYFRRQGSKVNGDANSKRRMSGMGRRKSGARHSPRLSMRNRDIALHPHVYAAE